MHFDIKQAFSFKVKVAQVSALQVDSLPAEPPEKPKNTGVGSLSLLQQIFPTQELNRGLLCCRLIIYQPSYEGSPLNSKESFKNLLDSVL